MIKHILIFCLVALFLGSCKEPDPYGAERVSAESKRVRAGECSIIGDTDNLCIYDGIPIGSIEHSPFAAFAMALESLTLKRGFLGVCRTVGEDREPLDLAYWSDLQGAVNDCSTKKGRWISSGELYEGYEKRRSTDQQPATD